MKSRGFTLIELAIVLVIITILIGGLAVPLSAQIQARRVAETQKTLEEARDTIMGFAISNACAINCSGSVCAAIHSCDTTSCNTYCSNAVANGWPSSTRRHFLPCPDINNDGIEDRTGDVCTQSQGNLPWVTLGAASQDAWGNRLQYSVSNPFTNRSLGFNNGSLGNNQVCTSAAAGCASGNLADNLPAVVLSHGANGRGATSINGIAQAAPAGTDELDNALSDADQQFVSRTPYKPADSSAAEIAKEFDDQVIWIPTPLLITRVCPAAGCL